MEWKTPGTRRAFFIVEAIPWVWRLGRKFDIGGIGMRLGNRLTFFAQAIEVEGDRLSHVLLDFGAVFSC